MKLTLGVVLCLGLCSLDRVWANDSGEADGERLAWSIVPNVVRISETVPAGRSGEEGFGLVVGERNGDLYAITADHVVRNGDGQPYGTVQVTFKADQGDPRDATLLDLRIPQRHGDLAVLRFAKPAHLNLIWPAAANVTDLVEGARAWRVGKQERWTPSVSPGEYVGLQQTIWLAFDSLDTPPGSSGGPVVTDEGVIGLVIADGGSSGAADAVLPIDTIQRQLRLWSVPWNLTPPTQSQNPPSPPAQTSPPNASVPAVQPLLTPAPDDRLLIKSVKEFLLRYYAGLSDRDDAVLARLPQDISDPIDFFGKRLSLSDYLQQQKKYFHRWPERRFDLQLESVAVHCSHIDIRCEVSGEITYDVRDPASSRRSVGTERIFVRLQRVDNRFVIDQQG